MPSVTLTRTVTFSSGHRYWLPHLTEQENRARFGKWASPYNHGHNYILTVSASGPVDPATGMVVNIKEIDDELQRLVVAAFDQKSINDEVPGFDRRAPSLENLLLHFRDTLSHLPGGVRLRAMRLEETPVLAGEWTMTDAGEKLTLSRTYEFAAAHRLHDPALTEQENLDLFGKCNNPAGHGHNYLVEVTVSGAPDAESGMMLDLEALDAVVDREVVERYDHRNLNVDLPEFQGVNPTSEVVALEIFRRLDGQVPGKLERVRLHETARSVFEVTADDLS